MGITDTVFRFRIDGPGGYMHTVNAIEVIGEPNSVRRRMYALAADIESWPDLLPHYRYMRVTASSDRTKVADFGASRDGLPVRWRAVQELFPADFRITFRHVGGVTKGMWVEWRFAMAEDRVRVEIEHELSYGVPLLGPLFADYIVGRLFVENIAGKTLRRMKEIVEAEAAEGADPV